MARKKAPWMIDSDRLDAETAAKEKAIVRARGSKLFAILPWRSDARYQGPDVIKWYKSRKLAEGYALKIDGGRNLVVREWTYLYNPDGEATKPPAQLDREIAAALDAPLTERDYEVAARFEMKRYGLTKTEATRFVKLPDYLALRSAVEQWRLAQGVAASSPLARGYALDKIGR